MNILVEEGFTEIASLAVSNIPNILQSLFGGYIQETTLEDLMKAQHGQVLLPAVQFIPKRIELKTKAIKNTFCNALYTTYSKYPEAKTECSRFILKNKELTKEAFVEKLPPLIGGALFDIENDHTFLDFINLLEGIPADRIAYWYNPTQCEGYVSHGIAIIYEFGKEENPYCVSTVYFTIQVTK